MLGSNSMTSAIFHITFHVGLALLPDMSLLRVDLSIPASRARSAIVHCGAITAAKHAQQLVELILRHYGTRATRPSIGVMFFCVVSHASMIRDLWATDHTLGGANLPKANIFSISCWRRECRL